MPTYLADAWFLRDLVRHLTPGKDEEISYVTGLRVAQVRVLSRIRAVSLAQHSAVYARGTARSCSDALIEILEAIKHLTQAVTQGLPIHVVLQEHASAQAQRPLVGRFVRRFAVTGGIPLERLRFSARLATNLGESRRAF